MNNIYLFISLLCIIFLNCFWRAYITKRREGFNIEKIGREVGKVTDFVKKNAREVGKVNDFVKKIGREVGKVTDFVKNFDPGKLIDEVLGKIIDSILGSVPILKDIHKKVKKENGFIDKFKTTFFELFISLLTIIFLPLGAFVCLYLVYQLFLVMLANIPMLFQPNSLLSYIC